MASAPTRDSRRLFIVSGLGEGNTARYTARNGLGAIAANPALEVPMSGNNADASQSLRSRLPRHSLTPQPTLPRIAKEALESAT